MGASTRRDIVFNYKGEGERPYCTVDPKLFESDMNETGGIDNHGLPHHHGPPKAVALRRKTPHRRSPHACDECRLRKRACDAKKPVCGSCQASKLACTYQFRRPVPSPTLRIRNLQDHIRQARSWLQQVQRHVPYIPGLDLAECIRALDFSSLEEDTNTGPLYEQHQHQQHQQQGGSRPPFATAADQRGGGGRVSNISSSTLLQNDDMLAGHGQLMSDVCTDGATFYGAYSGLSFLIRTLAMFRVDDGGGGVGVGKHDGNKATQQELQSRLIRCLFSRSLPTDDRPSSSRTTPAAVYHHHHQDQSRRVPPVSNPVPLIKALCSRRHMMLAFLRDEELERLVANFDTKNANKFTSAPPSRDRDRDRDTRRDGGNSSSSSSSSSSGASGALLQTALALGCLFDSGLHRQEGCAAVIDRGTEHVHAGLAMANDTLLRSTNKQTSNSSFALLQALLCATFFLMSTSRMTSAHALIGTSCSLASRLGLFSPPPPSPSEEDHQQQQQQRDSSSRSSTNTNTMSSSTKKHRTQLLGALISYDALLSLILDLPPLISGNQYHHHHHQATAAQWTSSSQLAIMAHGAEAERDWPTAALLHQAGLLVMTISLRWRRQPPTTTTPTTAAPRSAWLLELAQQEFHTWKMDTAHLLHCLATAAMTQDKETAILKQDLEMAYSFSQIVLFRPYLHHLSNNNNNSTTGGGGGGSGMPPPPHMLSSNEVQIGLACIKIASTTIVRASSTSNSGSSRHGWRRWRWRQRAVATTNESADVNLHDDDDDDNDDDDYDVDDNDNNITPPFPMGSWLSTYTVFQSVMCLTFLIASHMGSTSQPNVAWRRAVAGIRVLAVCRCDHDLTSGCLDALKIVENSLRHTVFFDLDRMEASVRKRCDARRCSEEEKDTSKQQQRHFSSSATTTTTTQSAAAAASATGGGGGGGTNIHPPPTRSSDITDYVQYPPGSSRMSGGGRDDDGNDDNPHGFLSPPSRSTSSHDDEDDIMRRRPAASDYGKHHLNHVDNDADYMLACAEESFVEDFDLGSVLLLSPMMDDDDVDDHYQG